MLRQLCAISAIAISGCVAADKGDVIIGALIDQTGNDAETSWVQAVQLAESHMNQALAAEGSDIKFKLLLQDSANTPAIGAERAAALVEEHSALALLGGSSQVSEAIMRLMYQDGAEFQVPYQCSSCTSGNLLNPTYTNPDDIVLQRLRNDGLHLMSRTTTTSGPEAFVSLDILRSENGGNIDRNGDGFLKATIYYSDESFGQAASTSLQAAIPTMFPTFASSLQLAIEVIPHDATIDPSQVDYIGDINGKILNPDINVGTTTTPDTHLPDFVVVASTATNSAYFQQAYHDVAAPNAPPLIYYHRYRQSNSIYQLASDVLAGSEGVSMVVIDGASGEQFERDFIAANGFSPPFWGSGYYDNATTLMLAALIGSGVQRNAITSEGIRASVTLTSAVTGDRNGGASPITITAGVDGLRTAISAIRGGQPINYEGASGPLDYSDTRNVLDRLTHYVAQDGVFVDVQSYDCISDSKHCGVSVP